MTANVRRLQPLRVLLCSRDRRFLRVTSFLLSRRGYEVAETGLHDVVETAERERADIVLIEPSDVRADAARAMAALQASAASPGLVLVYDDGKSWDWNGVPALPKWSRIEELIDEVEAAALRRVPPHLPAMLAQREQPPR